MFAQLWGQERRRRNQCREIGYPVDSHRRRTRDRGCLRARRGGAQVETAYLFCPEGNLAALCDALWQAGADTTVVTDVFTERPALALSNRLTRELGPLGGVTPNFPTPIVGRRPPSFTYIERG